MPVARGNRKGISGGGKAGAMGWRVSWRWCADGENTRHYATYFTPTAEEASMAWRADYQCRMTYQLVSVVPLSEAWRPQPGGWCYHGSDGLDVACVVHNGRSSRKQGAQ